MSVMGTQEAFSLENIYVCLSLTVSPYQRWTEALVSFKKIPQNKTEPYLKLEKQLKPWTASL